MTLVEDAVVFDCGGDTLVGVVATGQAHSGTGVVILVGGPQYRAGSHRYFVSLARALSAAGYPTMRFDYRGMGDSSGDQRTFEQLDQDIRAAIDTLLSRVPRLQRVVLWGLCDGASAALLFLHATADPRVSGVCMVNPWVRSPASLARTHVKHYYARRLGQWEFWRKLFGSRHLFAATTELVHNIRLAQRRPDAAGFQDRMAAALRGFGGPILLLLSENDYTAKEFVEYTRVHPSWRGLLQRAGLAQHVLPGADHTLSGPETEAHAQRLILRWLYENYRFDSHTFSRHGGFAA